MRATSSLAGHTSRQLSNILTRRKLLLQLTTNASELNLFEAESYCF
jgi:hypothetical protein